MVKISITLTASKIMALLVLCASLLLDLKNGTTTLLMALPAIVVLVTGKQYFDKEIKLKTPPDETTN